MPADPRYDVVHEKTRAGADFRYGCNGKPRPKTDGFIVGAACYGSQKWKFKNSTECKHDKRETDPGCTGCPHIANKESM